MYLFQVFRPFNLTRRAEVAVGELKVFDGGSDIGLVDVIYLFHAILCLPY